MSDYEEYWSEREKENTEKAPEEMDPVVEIYNLNGETVEVMLYPGYAVFAYENGTTREIPLSDLYFCPKCIKEGLLPFSEEELCDIHRMKRIKFSLTEYEEFKIASQMPGGMLVPQ